MNVCNAPMGVRCRFKRNLKGTELHKQGYEIGCAYEGECPFKLEIKG